MANSEARLLLVDDDPDLLGVMTTYLSRLGYEVVACLTAEEAWRIVEAAPARYSLVLVDLSLPGMSGRELARRILDSSPSAKVIVASGYPDNGDQLGMLDSTRVRFLQKPFAPSDLVEVVGLGLGRNC